MLKDFWEWLKGALAAVYTKDGLRGVALAVLLLLVVLVVLALVAWWLGIDVGGGIMPLRVNWNS